jgi:hypothetical protein
MARVVLLWRLTPRLPNTACHEGIGAAAKHRLEGRIGSHPDSRVLGVQDVNLAGASRSEGRGWAIPASRRLR